MEEVSRKPSNFTSAFASAFFTQVEASSLLQPNPDLEPQVPVPSLEGLQLPEMAWSRRIDALPSQLSVFKACN